MSRASHRKNHVSVRGWVPGVDSARTSVLRLADTHRLTLHIRTFNSRLTSV